MKALALRLLRVQPDEEVPAFLFFLLSAIIHLGLAIGANTANTLLLTQVGPSQLAVIYMVTPLLMLVYIPTFSYLVGRFGTQRVLTVTLVAIAVGAVALLLLTTVPDEPPLVLFYIAKLFASLWLIALYTLFWNFTDAFFDITQAKRLYALFSGGAALGAILGGLAVALLASRTGVEPLFAVWAVSALAALPTLFAIVKRCRPLEYDDLDDPEEPSFTRQTLEALGAASRSRYAQLLCAAFFVMVTLSTLCEFQYMTVFARELETSASETVRTSSEAEGLPEETVAAMVAERWQSELAKLLGLLTALASVANLIINFFLFNRLATQWGIRNLTLIQPVVYLVTFAFLALSNSMSAALFAFFAFQTIGLSVDYNVANLLLSALPSNVKKQLRTAIEGLCEPFAVAAAGVLLAFIGGTVSSETVRAYVAEWSVNLSDFVANLFTVWDAEAISALGIVGCLISLVIVFAVRYHYPIALRANLRRSWLDFSAPPRPFRPAELDRLEQLSADAPLDQQFLAVRLLAQQRPLPALRRLQVITAHKLSEDEIQAAKVALEKVLASQDPQTLLEAQQWIARQPGPLTPKIAEALGQLNLLAPAWLHGLDEADDPGAFLARATSRFHSSHPHLVSGAVRETLEVIEKASPSRPAAFEALGASRMPQFALFLTGFLSDPDPASRLAAIKAIARLANRSVPSAVPPIIELLKDSDPAIRRHAIEALSRILDSSSVHALLHAAELFTPSERAMAEAAITRTGLEAVPSLVAALETSGSSLGTKSIAARALSKLAPAQLESLAPGLLEKELSEAEAAMRQVAFAQTADSPAGRLLDRVQMDRAKVHVLFFTELLAVTGKLSDYEMLAAALASSSRKEKATAIETIEQGCPTRLFPRLLPLLLGERAAGRSETDLPSLAQTSDPVQAPLALQLMAELKHPQFPACLAIAISDLMPPHAGAALSPAREFARQSLACLISGNGDGRETPAIVVLDRLARTRVFETLLISDLLIVLTRLKVERFDPKAIWPVERALCLTLQGEIERGGPGAYRDYPPGLIEFLTDGMETSSARGGNAATVAAVLSHDDLTQLSSALPRLAAALVQASLNVPKVEAR